MTSQSETKQKCGCPDDCNCRSPWRANYCGCKAHQTDEPLPEYHYDNEGHRIHDA